MKKYLFLLAMLGLLTGCNHGPRDKDVLVKINECKITKQEFEVMFRESSFSRQDTPESRADFLNNLIDRQIILQDAQERGLDKSKEFIGMIQKFWEQSLLKTALEKKSKEIAGSISINDKSVEAAYNKMFKEGKTDKFYNQMYQQVKWELTRARESDLMNSWLQGLRKNSNIEINRSLPGNDK